MSPGPLLTTSALPGGALPGWTGAVFPATLERLPTAAGLLAAHDGEPVADVRGRPDRWAQLTLMSGAVRRGLPVLAWGSGAALVGRALGARVQTGAFSGLAAEWAEVPRGAVAEKWQGEVPLLWRVGQVTAWAGLTLPDQLRASFLAGLDDSAPRLPGTPLEALGGEAVLRTLLADFYARAREDELLGPVFAAHVEDWNAHQDRVTAFWVTMLGGEVAWRGNLNGVHAGLGIRAPHVARWLTLFRQAAKAHLAPKAAALLLARAEAMGARLGPRGNPPHARRVR